MTRILVVVVIALLSGSHVVSQQAPASRSGLIAGQVVDATSGAGLAESIVTLTPAGPVSSPAAARDAATRVITDSRGRFVFANLPRGPYRLGVIKPGYRGGGLGQTTPRSVGQVLELGDGERALEGGRRLVPVLNGTTTTDDRGIYRAGDLDPGASFVVSV